MQAQVLRTFDERIPGPDGLEYVIKICGRLRADGKWEGWVEFVPQGSGPVLRSRRETTQSNLRSLEDWAARLRRVYLEGALARALHLQKPRRRAAAPPPPAPPYFDAPSPGPAASRTPVPDDVPLNPVLWYRRGESRLREKLAGLGPSDLRMIARAYGFDQEVGADADSLSREALVELIVAVARNRAT